LVLLKLLVVFSSTIDWTAFHIIGVVEFSLTCVTVVIMSFLVALVLEYGKTISTALYG